MSNDYREDFFKSDVPSKLLAAGVPFENLERAEMLIFMHKADSIQRVGFKRAIELEVNRFKKEGKDYYVAIAKTLISKEFTPNTNIKEFIKNI